MRVLLIEDSRHLIDAVAQILRQARYVVDTTLDGDEGLALACSGVYDAIVLDIMLPKKDGVAVLRELRAKGIATPVLLLTAKSQIEDRVRGLDAGADDYLSKPFHADELQARLRALARRPPTVNADDTISFADAKLDPNTMQLACGMRTENLRPTDARLLELLARNQGIIVSKEQIIAKLWGPGSFADANRVEVHVSRVRKALARVGTSAQIRTVRGVGYTLNERKE
ncbi:response regulator transcription factor [Raoultibacter phocaeensis]|uniref:response regulator transcription factor n=1 Tax=Raoultibacter phocaeensis TaxID=2479841 RepID=UPI0011189B24|nr:response regulator transcription factor [Raoultibacter phocaeensis]